MPLRRMVYPASRISNRCLAVTINGFKDDGISY